MVEWIVDTGAQDNAKAWGEELDQISVDIGSINESMGLHNNARPDGSVLMEDHVLAIAIGMEQGKRIPMITIIEIKKGVYMVIDGNHRFVAYKKYIAGTKGNPQKIPCHILRCDDQQTIECMTRTINAGGSRGLDEDAKIHNALALVEKWPTLSNAKVAERIGVEPKRFTARLRTERIRNVLTARRIGTAQMADTTINAIGKLEHSEPVMFTAAHMIKDLGLSSKEADEIAKEVKACRSEAKQLEKLDEIEKRYHHRSAKLVALKPRLRNKQKLWHFIGLGLKLFRTCPTPEHLQLTDRTSQQEAQRDVETLIPMMKKGVGLE